MQTLTVHRWGAAVLLVFTAVHLSVHLSALWGIESHRAALAFVQQAYRHPAGEAVLVAAILSQVATGLMRIRFRGTRGWERARAISGLYLAYFLVMHTGAALYTHHLFGLETDFFWAAGSLHYPPLSYAFALYYLLAVLALFVHLGAALRFRRPGWPRALSMSLPVAGAATGALIVAAFAGIFYAIEIPESAAAYYEQNFGIDTGKD